MRKRADAEPTNEVKRVIIDYLQCLPHVVVMLLRTV
jgi:hypothetical protein